MNIQSGHLPIRRMNTQGTACKSLQLFLQEASFAVAQCIWMLYTVKCMTVVNLCLCTIASKSEPIPRYLTCRSSLTNHVRCKVTYFGECSIFRTAIKEQQFLSCINKKFI